jgi:hypothetical protein
MEAIVKSSELEHVKLVAALKAAYAPAETSLAIEEAEGLVEHPPRPRLTKTAPTAHASESRERPVPTGLRATKEVIEVFMDLNIARREQL